MISEPIASGTCDPVRDVKPIQDAATVTPKTAARSSSSTTLTDGSCPLRTVNQKIIIKHRITEKLAFLITLYFQHGI